MGRYPAGMRFEYLAIFEELDRDLDPTLGSYIEEVQEFGEFTEAGATLSRADFEDARANL